MGGSIPKNKMYILLSIILIQTLGLSGSAHAGDSLTPQEIINRCFMVFAKMPLSSMDVRRSWVGTDETRATQLCEALIDSPVLNKLSGKIYNSKPYTIPTDKFGTKQTGPVSGAYVTDQEALSVARTLHDLHRSFFSRDKFESVREEDSITRQIIDASAPAGYFTYAALKATPDFSLAVTEANDIRIIRAGLSSSPMGNTYRKSDDSYWVTAYDGNKCGNSTSEDGHCGYPDDADNYCDKGTLIHDPNGDYCIDKDKNKIQDAKIVPTYSFQKNASNANIFIGVDRGDLNGLIPTTSGAWVNNVPVTVEPKIQKSNGVYSERGFEAISRKTLGGGFLGHPSFLVLNFGTNVDTFRADGALKMPRSYALEVMKVAMCRSAPFLTAKDYDDNFSSEGSNASGAPAFRSGGSSCMRCHSGIDPLAMAVKNVTLNHMGMIEPKRYDGKTQPVPSGYDSASWAVRYHLPAVRTSTSSGYNGLWWPVAGDSNFYKYNSDARLTFRSAKDFSIVKKQVATTQNGKVSLAPMGSAIADQWDYYACGVKRYLQFATGQEIDFNVVADNDADNPLSATQKTTWNIIKYLTNGAKSDGFFQHKNVKTLLKAIIKTNVFTSRSYGKMTWKSSYYWDATTATNATANTSGTYTVSTATKVSTSTTTSTKTSTTTSTGTTGTYNYGTSSAAGTSSATSGSSAGSSSSGTATKKTGTGK